MDIISSQIYGNALETWFVTLGVALLMVIVLQLAKRLIKGRLVSLIKKSPTEIDDFLLPLLRQTRFFFFVIIGLYVGSQFLTLSEADQTLLARILRIAFFLQLGIWGMGLIDFYVNRGVSGKLDEDDGEVATTIDIFGLLGKIVLWVVVGLLILDNMKVEVNSLIASLGIGGIAVALAVQNVLGDLFASLSIAMDKPFVIGDFIVVDEFAGTVEDIGLKSTRIRSLSGEELIFSNSDLLSSRIRNFKRLQERRIVFSFGASYDTPHEKLQQIPSLVKEVIEPLEKVRFDRCHLKEMGDYALNYEVVYFVKEPDYNFYMDVQEKINLKLFKHLEEQNISLPYPTKRVILEQ